jgi:2-hydroxychromene-2-carboxylate isomerase
MARTVDFYFDYLSPYAYLAWTCLPEVTDPRGVEIAPRPVLFAGLLNHWGQLGPAEIPPKNIHVFKDTHRFAALRGIPLRSPRYHPFRPLIALRVSLAVVARDRQKSVITALYKAGWVEGIDLGDRMEIRQALDDAGLNGEELIAAAEEPLAKDTLRAETDAAIDGGVFGIPTMIVDGELFWGLDQLQHLERYLDGKDPLGSVENTGQDSPLDRLLRSSRAVVRPGSVGRGQGNDGEVMKRS